MESLEHALLPEQAVAELCRVVRPGGSVLVIDKDRAETAALALRSLGAMVYAPGALRLAWPLVRRGVRLAGRPSGRPSRPRSVSRRPRPAEKSHFPAMNRRDTIKRL